MADKFEDVFEPIPSAPPAEDFEPVEESTTIPMARGYAPIFAPTFSPPQGNIRPSHIKEAAFTPLATVPRVTATDLSNDPGRFEQVVAGANRGAAGIAESFLSPVGLATLGVGMLPRLAGRAISGLFAADMARHVPETARAFGEAVGEGDLERSVETGIGATANIGFTGLAGTHALAPNRPVATVKPKVEEPVAKPVVEPEVISPELERALVEAERAPVPEVPKSEPQVAQMTQIPEVETIAPKAEPVAAVPETKPVVAETDVAKIVTPEEAPVVKESLRTEPSFQDWRIQGNVIRSSRVGQRLTEDQAQSIIDSMPAFGTRGRYDAKKGVVVVNSGLMSDVQRLWEAQGSFAKKTGKQKAEREAVQSARTGVESARATELEASPAAKWIDDVFGADTMNNFNKLELAKFIEGKTEKFGGGTNPKWRTGLEKIGAASLDDIKRAFGESTALKAKSKLETWADETIKDAKDRFSSGVDPVLMTAYSVKAAHILGRGITEVGAWSTEMVKEYGEDIRPYLPEIRKRAEAMVAAGTLSQVAAAERTGPGDSPAMGERQTPKKIDTLDYVSQEAKMRQGPRLYERRSNETDAAAAARAIDEGGVEGSIRDFTDMDVEMPAALRTALGFELQKRLAREEQMAALEGNPEASKAAVDRHIGLLEAITERSTELAQGLQAYSAFTRATPAVLYGWARRQVNKAGGRAIEGLRGGLDKIKETVREVNEKVAEDVAKATEKGLWTLEKEASVEKLVAAAKSRLGGGREKGPVEEFAARLTTQLRAELLKRLPKRAAAVEKLTDAQILREAATNPEKYAEVWKEAQAALRKEFEGNDAALEVIDRAVGNITPELFSTKAIEGLVREEMGAQGLEFRKLIREHYTRQDAAGKSLAQKIVERVGVDEANAAKLAAAVEKRFAEMATERKRAALKALSLPGRLKVKAKALHDKVIELSNLGALDSEAFDAVVKEKLGVSKWDREFAEKVKAAAEAVQAAPEGAQRNSKAIDLMSLVEKQKGTKWYEIPLAIWMTNILTGVGTHAVNLASTGLNTMAETAFQIARKPTHTMSILEAAADGFRKGILEAKDAVRTGKVTGSRLQKVEAMRPLENTTFKGPLKFLNAWKYNFRLMTAADLMIFKSAEEVRSYTAAVELARKEGVRGAELERRVRETLGDTRERLAEAEAIADAEGLKGTDRQRRIDEVIEQGRPEELRQDARDFALRATFNEKPWGLLGSLAEGVNHVTRNRPEAKLVVPFTNIVANVVNRSLDYFPPVGGARYGWAKWSGMIEGKPATEAMIKETLARATAGTALMTGATLAVMKFINDEDPLFMVTGNGPRTPDQKKQLMETGWIPNSIKIGKNYYSYGWTPAAAPMAWLGNLADGYRYKKLEKTDLANRAAYAAALMPKVIMDQSFMSSLADIMTMLERDSTKRAGDIAAKRLFNTATSFAVPNLVRQVDRIFDPTIYEARDIEANMVASIPFARRLNRPALNVLGEPAERYVSERFLKLGKSDPVWRVMADKQAWVSVPDRETMINKRPMTDDEYYQFVETSGKAIRKELERELKAIQAATPDDAKKIVQDIVRDARADAKFTLERKR